MVCFNLSTGRMNQFEPHEVGGTAYSLKQTPAGGEYDKLKAFTKGDKNYQRTPQRTLSLAQFTSTIFLMLLLDQDQSCTTQWDA